MHGPMTSEEEYHNRRDRKRCCR